MVESVLRAADPRIPVALVGAWKSEAARAERIELCAITCDGYEGEGRSPGSGGP
jgi:hypothetical protein